jgi:hypothetical protein
VLKQKIAIFILITLSCANLAQASFSTSYELNEESLSYGSNVEFLESASYMMDLGDMAWVDRNSDSLNYALIDGNSMFFDTTVTPPTPPTPPPTGGGGGSSIAGGKAPHYDSDSPIVVSSESAEDRDLNKLPVDQLPVEDQLHEAPEEKPIHIAYVPDIPVPAVDKIEAEELHEAETEPSLSTPNIVNNYYINTADDDSFCGCFHWDFLIIIIILCLTLISITILSIWGKHKK